MQVSLLDCVFFILINENATMYDALLALSPSKRLSKSLFIIGDTRVPGQVGLHTIFWKSCLVILKEELVSDVLHTVNSAVIPERWNAKIISLISKVDASDKITQYRPINLCTIF